MSTPSSSDACSCRWVFLLLTMMAIVAMLAVWLFKRSVLDRLARAEAAISAVRCRRLLAGAQAVRRRRSSAGWPSPSTAWHHPVKLNRDELEEAVRERTQQLGEHRLSRPPMCGVLNRRGAVAAFAEAGQMSERLGAATGSA